MNILCLMNWKKLPAWLKGGLIGAGLSVLFWGIIAVYILIAASRSHEAGLAFLGVIIYLPLSAIQTFITGAIIGYFSGNAYAKEKKVITVYTKRGFVVGLIITIVSFIFMIWDNYVSISHGYQDPVAIYRLFDLGIISYFNLLFIPFAAAWLFWVIGSLRRWPIQLRGGIVAAAVVVVGFIVFGIQRSIGQDFSSVTLIIVGRIFSSIPFAIGIGFVVGIVVYGIARLSR